MSAKEGEWDKRALLLGLGAIALVALVGVAGWWAWGFDSRPEDPRESVIEFVRWHLGFGGHRCRRCSPQSNAIAACKEVASAQSIWHRTDWDNDGVLEYASSFPLLYKQTDASGQEIKLIGEALSVANRPAMAIHGYYFVDITADGAGGPYQIAGNQPNEYGICAVPAQYPRSGRETYIMDTTGTVYAKDNGGVAVTVFPASPRAEGWVVTE